MRAADTSNQRVKEVEAKREEGWGEGRRGKGGGGLERGRLRTRKEREVKERGRIGGREREIGKEVE